MTIYYPSIPASTDNPSNSQGQIQTNFGTINTAFSVNHTPLTNSTNQGLHTFVGMPFLSSPPTTVPGEGAVYTESATGTQLAYVSDNNQTGSPSAVPDVYQLTRTIHASYPSFGSYGAFGTVTTNYTMNAGWTFLPGGLLLQYGSVVSNLATPQIKPDTIVVTFPVVFTTANVIPTISQICKAAGTGEDDVASIVNTTISATGFTVNYSVQTSAYVGFTWFAIGV